MSLKSEDFVRREYSNRLIDGCQESHRDGTLNSSYMFVEIEQIKRALEKKNQQECQWVDTDDVNIITGNNEKGTIWTKLAKDFDVLGTSKSSYRSTQNNFGTSNSHLKQDICAQRKTSQTLVTNRPSRVWDLISTSLHDSNPRLTQSTISQGLPEVSTKRRNPKLDDIFFKNQRPSFTDKDPILPYVSHSDTSTKINPFSSAPRLISFPHEKFVYNTPIDFNHQTRYEQIMNSDIPTSSLTSSCHAHLVAPGTDLNEVSSRWSSAHDEHFELAESILRCDVSNFAEFEKEKEEIQKKAIQMLLALHLKVKRLKEKIKSYQMELESRDWTINQLRHQIVLLETRGDSMSLMFNPANESTRTCRKVLHEKYEKSEGNLQSLKPGLSTAKSHIHEFGQQVPYFIITSPEECPAQTANENGTQFIDSRMELASINVCQNGTPMNRENDIPDRIISQSPSTKAAVISQSSGSFRVYNSPTTLIVSPFANSTSGQHISDSIRSLSRKKENYVLKSSNKLDYSDFSFASGEHSDGSAFKESSNGGQSFKKLPLLLSENSDVEQTGVVETPSMTVFPTHIVPEILHDSTSLNELATFALSAYPSPPLSGGNLATNVEICEANEKIIFDPDRTFQAQSEISTPEGRPNEFFAPTRSIQSSTVLESKVIRSSSSLTQSASHTMKETSISQEPIQEAKADVNDDAPLMNYQFLAETAVIAKERTLSAPAKQRRRIHLDRITPIFRTSPFNDNQPIPTLDVCIPGEAEDSLQSSENSVLLNQKTSASTGGVLKPCFSVEELSISGRASQTQTLTTKSESDPSQLLRPTVDFWTDPYACLAVAEQQPFSRVLISSSEVIENRLPESIVDVKESLSVQVLSDASLELITSTDSVNFVRTTCYNGIDETKSIIDTHEKSSSCS